MCVLAYDFRSVMVLIKRNCHSDVQFCNKKKKKERNRYERAKYGEDFRSIEDENCSTINNLL